MTTSSEKEKMLDGMLYTASDPQLVRERSRAKAACRAYNDWTGDDESSRRRILSALLGSVEGEFTIEPAFRCDYGYNIHLGKNFYSNFDLIVLDVCEVRIGDNCLCGPRVNILAATHPVDPEVRMNGLELGKPVRIGDNVWIGAGATINPGVEIGDNAIIGSGAVVTASVEANTIVGGVPAKVVRRLDSPAGR